MIVAARSAGGDTTGRAEVKEIREMEEVSIESFVLCAGLGYVLTKSRSLNCRRRKLISSRD